MFSKKIQNKIFCIVNTVRLVGIGKPPHSRHNAEDIVIDRIHADLRGQQCADRVVGERQAERRVVDTREVARARRLVLLRLEGERVHVDAHRGDVRVVLVRLDQVEVLALALAEAVVAVELDLRRHDGVLARHALHTRHGVAGLEDGAVEPVRVVERLLALVGIHRRIAGDEAVALDDPDKLLRGVVEVELDLVRRGRHGLTARELELLDQVLVRDLGEAAALIRVEVDVVDVERRGHEARGSHAVADGVRGGAVGRNIPAEVTELVELEPHLNLVVLERDQREREARVAAEPELERDVQRVIRRALADLRRAIRLGVGRAVRIAILTALDEEVDELRHVADHLGVTGLLAGLLGELIPDLEPVTIVLVNLLATDLNVHIVDQVVANPVEPAELRTRAVRRHEADLGERGLEVHTVDEIAVTADRALHLLAEVRRAVERLLNGLHGEVRVAAVYDLEERNLRVARQVDILCTIRDELH